jgi:predicted Zn-dependent peptidase
VVSATFVLEGGAGVQAEGEAGLAQLAAAMLDEGTTSRSSLAIAEAIEGMGATLSASCGWDGSYVSLQCLAPHLPAVVEMAVDVIRNPTFPESEWTRIHGQTLAALKAEHDRAEARTHRGLLRSLYPEGHPYRFPIDGETEIVGRLTRADVAAFHQRYHGPGGAAVVVAGDVDPDVLALELDELLAGWNLPRPPHSEVARLALALQPRILLLDRPGAAQAAVRVGHVGVPRLDPGYTDALVLNQILGGQFTSRLNTRLREEKGFTYGIRSHFDFRRGAGPFQISASLEAGRIAEALEDIRNEVLALLDDRPPTQSELEDARRSLIEGQPRHFDTPEALVSRYASLLVHELPADHHARFAERLDAVTVETLRSVGARVIQPEALVVVVVADAELVFEPLRQLKWAEASLAGE